MKVTILALTTINWQELERIGSSVLGRSPTRSLDMARMSARDTFSYIATLGELVTEGSDPRTIVKNSDFQLHHINITFAVEVTPHEFDLLRNLEGLVVTSLKGIQKYDDASSSLLLISGTLAAFRLILPSILRSRPKDFLSTCRHTLFTHIFQIFKTINLGELFI